MPHSLDEGADKFLSLNFGVLQIVGFFIMKKPMIYPRWFTAPTFIRFVTSFSLSYCFPPIIVMKIYLMQVCNIYITTSMALRQVQA